MIITSKEIMMKLLFTASILLFSASVFAHNNFSSQACDVELTADIQITKDTIEFSENDSALYQIRKDKYLYVAGEKVSLSSSQQVLITDYSDKIRALGPEIKVIALEGIDLAVNGVNEAFYALLGDNNTVGQELTAKLENLAQQIDTGLNNEFTINDQGFSFNEQTFDQAFDQQIDDIIEHSISNAAGSLLIALGQQVLSSSGDSNSFTQRMADFGANIEDKLEARADILAEKADNLCHLVESIDQTEQQLKANIEALSNFDVLVVDYASKQSI
jgi:hypothetical protein